MMSEVFGDMISLYSRSDALRDGVLIEADPQLCREAGIRFPVAITDHLWGYIDPGYLGEMPGQSIQGRLWDLLWMFTLAVKRSTSPSDRLTFRVLFLMKRGRTPRLEEITIVSICGPGDDAEPVLTLMLPEDD